MIDKDAFSAGMALLAGTFGRNADAAVNRAYYLVLSPQLSTDEFETAVERTIATETFWPSPAVLIEKIRPRSSARVALAEVRDIVSRSGGFRFFTYEQFQKFTPAQKAGIKAAGGLGALSTAEGERRIAVVERLFIEGYETEAANTPATEAIRIQNRRAVSAASEVRP